MNWTYLLIIAAVFGAITLAIGRSKQIPATEAFLWGALLGLIGVIVVLCSKTRAPLGDARRAVLALQRHAERQSRPG